MCTGGGREEKLARLAAAQAGEAGASAHMSAESAPANLHAMSVPQLRAVCAAHGLVPPDGAGSEELISLLESRHDAHAALEGGGLEAGGQARLLGGGGDGNEAAEGEDEEDAGGEAEGADEDEDSS
mgnify:CR=1 FL=1